MSRLVASTVDWFLGLCCLFLLNPAAAQEPLRNTHHSANLHYSIVQLRVPTSRLVDGYRRHHQENCSATVIDTTPLTLLSAWHCFDGYDDLSRSPHILVGNHWVKARLLSTGGSMSADWALVTADASQIELPHTLHPLPLLSGEDTLLAAVIRVAGYPNSSGHQLPELWLSQGCPILDKTQQWISTKCSAKKGVSGGPALLQRNARWFVVGVVSAARQSDQTLLVTPLPPVATLSLSGSPINISDVRINQLGR